jgi:hypothetical protein
MKLAILALTALLLTGCVTLDGHIDNRIVCTVAGDKLYALSEWGPVGISARISDKDREKVCK